MLGPELTAERGRESSWQRAERSCQAAEGWRPAELPWGADGGQPGCGVGGREEDTLPRTVAEGACSPRAGVLSAPLRFHCNSPEKPRRCGSQCPRRGNQGAERSSHQPRSHSWETSPAGPPPQRRSPGLSAPEQEVGFGQACCPKGLRLAVRGSRGRWPPFSPLMGGLAPTGRAPRWAQTGDTRPLLGRSVCRGRAGPLGRGGTR